MSSILSLKCKTKLKFLSKQYFDNEMLIEEYYDTLRSRDSH
jgi:hypothetical protein